MTWAARVDTCARVLAVSAQRTRFWFHHSVRVTLYAVHRARQRIKGFAYRRITGFTP